MWRRFGRLLRRFYCRFSVVSPAKEVYIWLWLEPALHWTNVVQSFIKIEARFAQDRLLVAESQFFSNLHWDWCLTGNNWVELPSFVKWHDKNWYYRQIVMKQQIEIVEQSTKGTFVEWKCWWCTNGYIPVLIDAFTKITSQIKSWAKLEKELYIKKRARSFMK